MNNLIKSGVAVAILASASSVMAGSGQPEPGINYAFSGTFTLGGETVAQRVFESGKSTNVKSMDGYTLGGGIIYQDLNNPYGIKATIEHRFASEDEAGTSANVLNLTPYYQNNLHRFGLGISYHMSPELEYFGETIELDSALGWSLEYNYSWFEFKYVEIEYEFSQVPATLDSNYFSIGMSYAFQ